MSGNHDRPSVDRPESYEVFKLYFRRKEDKSGTLDEHVALYVKKGENGQMFHVIDDDKNSTKTLKHLKFDERDVEDTFLNNLQSLRKKEYIGVIPERKVNSLEATCKGLPNVVGLQRTAKPDCVTWFNNAVYQLDRKGIVHFRQDFNVPRKAEPLQVKDSSSRPSSSRPSSSHSSSSRPSSSHSSSSRPSASHSSSSRPSSSHPSSSKSSSSPKGEGKRSSSSKKK